MKKKIFSLFLPLIVLGLFAFSVPVKAVTTTSLINTDVNLGIFRDLTSEEISKYYRNIGTGLSGDNLLTSLQPILKKNQVKLNYDSGATGSSAWFGYYLLDRDWEKSPLTQNEKDTMQLGAAKWATSDIWMNPLYSTSPIKITTKINSGTYTFYDEDNKLKTVPYESSKKQFDREHVLPKSFGFNGTGERYKDLTAGCDMQNLHAGEHYGNSTGHSNYPYGTVALKNSTTAITSGITGEIIGYTGDNSKGIKVFEPLDIDKGDIARTIFYMCARYHKYEELGNGDNTPAITLSNSATSNNTTEPEDTKTLPAAYGELDDLLAWNKLDPVDYFEIHRNNLCYNAIQKNRNPFIDFPAWADVAFGDSLASADPNTSDGLTEEAGSDSLWLLNGTSNIEINEKLDLSAFSFKFGDKAGESSDVFLSNLTYKLYEDDTQIDITELSSYTFSRTGNYRIQFSYINPLDSEVYSADYVFSVINSYKVEITVPPADLNIKTGETFDFASYPLTLLDKDNNPLEVSDYTIEIKDANGQLVSTDKNYSFNKDGDYTIVISYKVGEETLSTTLSLTISPSQERMILYIVIVVSAIILGGIILVVSKKHRSKAKRAFKKTVTTKTRKSRK